MRSKKRRPRGAPAWMTTFADLSILLMCFFVLLLSFSEMDVHRYKQVMGSMRDAFGVQREVPAHDSPTGSILLADQISPGRPESSPLQVIQQQAESARVAPDVARRTTLEQTEADAAKLQELLKDEIEQGLLEVVREAETVTIRIRERGAFPSGEATLLEPFAPVIQKIARALETISGNLVVAGHTDSLPINTPRFRSNWELSAARAVTVVHHIQEESRIPPARLIIEGHAETRPLMPNDTWTNRALNRRVEIIIRQGGGAGPYRNLDALSQAN